MKRISVIVVLLVASAINAKVLGQSDAGASGDKNVKEHLVQLKRDWGRAYVRRDAYLLEQILADEYTVTDANGQTKSRAEIMADFKTGDTTYEATSYDDARVRIYGDVAVVAGRGMVKGRNKTGSFHSQYFSTNVFVRRNGRWQAVATHISGVTSI
jgi:ketosteroid isomerase-like protein